jgi:hypothetical protein
MIVVGAHYLPFIFLSGCCPFGLLAGFLISRGMAIGMYLAPTFSLRRWVTAVVLLAFAFIGRNVALGQSGCGHLRSQHVAADRG